MFPRGFGRPADARASWPDTMREMTVVVDEPGRSIEIIMPDAEIIRRQATIAEVTELDRVIGWIQDYALNCRVRGIRVGVVNSVWLGMLHGPVSGRRLLSWRKIGKRLGVSRETARRWYDQAIDRIAAMVNAQDRRQGG